MNIFSLKNFQDQLKKLDSKTIKLINIINMVSIIFCFLAILLMYSYYKFYISRFLYFGSITLFGTGLLIGFSAYIFGITINEYKEKQGQ